MPITRSSIASSQLPERDFGRQAAMARRQSIAVDADGVGLELARDLDPGAQRGTRPRDLDEIAFAQAEALGRAWRQRGAPQSGPRRDPHGLEAVPRRSERLAASGSVVGARGRDAVVR